MYKIMILIVFTGSQGLPHRSPKWQKCEVDLDCAFSCAGKERYKPGFHVACNYCSYGFCIGRVE